MDQVSELVAALLGLGEQNGERVLAIILGFYWWSRRGSNPWPPHCERELVGSTDYHAFLLVTKHSTKAAVRENLHSIASYSFPCVSLQSRQPDAKNVIQSFRILVLLSTDFKNVGEGTT